MKNLSHRNRRLWHWRMAHLWSVIRLRRRLILVTLLLGIAAALVINTKTRHIYAGRVILDPDSNPDPNTAR